MKLTVFFLFPYPNVATPAPPVDTPLCADTRDLFYGTTYLKSVCLVATDQDYDLSQFKCSSLGMELFMINSPEVQTEFFNYAESKFGTGSGARLWIGGGSPCSAIENSYGPFGVFDYPCSIAMYSFCEYSSPRESCLYLLLESTNLTNLLYQHHRKTQDHR